MVGFKRGAWRLPEETNNLVELTADIVSAYVQKNAVPVSGLPDLIASVNSALSNIVQATPVEAPAPKPAVNPRRSVFPDYIISLEDGRKYKALKRHLASRGMTPDQYRAKWGLAKDYPMVAPNYSATRSALARSLGLGRKAAPGKATPKRKAKA
ncbi:MucR family transcriptional regulator [Mesorhizobium sp. B2-8-9]|uniref:MucR family transcriptional regulator n=1 Tax=Mesorhizobium sp. B2-8-9 TaxID=2589899 RepID=UPI00112E4A68|nr:MucR family transcriptional regulator [Mesorhizobium sp. B2-8-9]TPI78003.1 transcriptional regulator [Mesorhizobium sp. B2-8-9]